MEKVDLSNAVKNSEKYKKAVEEGRVGGKAHKNGKPSEETKNKIRESLLKFYEGNTNSRQINIEKHREVMAKSKGKKVAQYSKENEFIREYISISEAGRISKIKKSNIQQVLAGNNKTAGGYIWKYVDEKNLKT